MVTAIGIAIGLVLVLIGIAPFLLAGRINRQMEEQAGDAPRL